MSIQRFGITLIIIAGCAAMSALAGDLNPPPGPILPTDRVTLSDADPLPITLVAPGSYVLTSNLVTLPGGIAIDIQSSNVTLDLNGFTIDGAGGTDGIIVAANLSAITIRNGVITGGQNGINASAAGITDLLIEGVHVHDCTVHAFQVGSAIMRSCVAANNLGDGFSATGDSALIDCRAIGNGQTGFNCTGGVIERCVAINNTFAGISMAGGGIVRDSIAKGNNTGIVATGGSSVIGCLASGNQFGGIEARDASLVESCQARGNGLAGTGSGIRLSLGSRAVECVSSFNTTRGYELDFQCVVDRCEAHGNIGAGVFVGGSDNRVTANQLYGNTPNLDASGVTGNLIMQNTADGGYSIGPGNSDAPVNAIGAAGPLDNITY